MTFSNASQIGFSKTYENPYLTSHIASFLTLHDMRALQGVNRSLHRPFLPSSPYGSFEELFSDMRTRLLSRPTYDPDTTALKEWRLLLHVCTCNGSSDAVTRAIDGCTTIPLDSYLGHPSWIFFKATARFFSHEAAQKRWGELHAPDTETPSHFNAAWELCFYVEKLTHKTRLDLLQEALTCITNPLEKGFYEVQSGLKALESLAPTLHANPLLVRAYIAVLKTEPRHQGLPRYELHPTLQRISSLLSPEDAQRCWWTLSKIPTEHTNAPLHCVAVANGFPLHHLTEAQRQSFEDEVLAKIREPSKKDFHIWQPLLKTLELLFPFIDIKKHPELYMLLCTLYTHFPRNPEHRDLVSSCLQSLCACFSSETGWLCWNEPVKFSAPWGYVQYYSLFKIQKQPLLQHLSEIDRKTLAQEAFDAIPQKQVVLFPTQKPPITQRSTYSAMSSTFSIETKDPKTEETVTTIAVLHITMPSKEKAADAFNHLNNLLIENGYLDADMSRPINWVAETNRLSPEEVKKVRNVGQNQLGRFAKTGTLIKVKDTQEPAPPRTASV